MHKRRRSKRIAAKKPPEEEKRQRLLSGDDAPWLPIEMIDRILQYIPYQCRGTLAGMDKYWSLQAWRVPLLVHGETRFGHDVDDTSKSGSYCDCTCPECHRKGLHSSPYRQDMCPCPLCLNQNELDILYDACNRAIDGVRHRAKQSEFRKDAKAVYEDTDRSVFFRHTNLYDVYESVTGGPNGHLFPLWLYSPEYRGECNPRAEWY